MRNEIRTLRTSIEEEDKMINQHNLDKEKLNNLWVIAKKMVDDSKAELMNKDREVKDLDENHIMTINLYKQKVKHLIFQNQDHHAEMKIELEQNLKQLEDQHRVEERELNTDNRYLKKKMREQELSNENFVFALKFDYDKNNTLERQEFEREARELKAKYDLKMGKVRQEMEELRTAKIKFLESKKDEKIKEIIAQHTQKYRDIKNYYNDITLSNLSFIKSQKNDIQQLQAKEEKDKRNLQRIEEQYKKLADPLKQIRDEQDVLRQNEKKWREIQEQKAKLRDEITKTELMYRELEFQYEVKLQNYKYLEKEKNVLFEKYEDTMYDIHQKAGLKVSVFCK